MRGVTSSIINSKNIIKALVKVKVKEQTIVAIAHSFTEKAKLVLTKIKIFTLRKETIIQAMKV